MDKKCGKVKCPVCDNERIVSRSQAWNIKTKKSTGICRSCSSKKQMKNRGGFIKNRHIFKVGHTSWNKGLKGCRGEYKLSEEHKRKIGLANKKAPKRYGKLASAWKGGMCIKDNYPCPVCGIDLYRMKKDAIRLCKKCWYKKYSGKNHYWYKDGRGKHYPYPPEFNKALKETIRQRDNYRCQTCGVSQQECLSALSIHHKDNDILNNKSENLISLCRKCHNRVHKGKKSGNTV